jgi:hypothetical protein
VEALSTAEPVREPFVVDVEHRAVVASFTADADFGFAAACARGDVDGADAERLADPESAQQQHHDERSLLAIRPALGSAEQLVGLVAVELEVRVLILDGRLGR